MQSKFDNMQRSTKGASKQRRENINTEIGVIRDLLPVHEAIRKRLSQLQVMALCKAFIGKSNAFSKLPKHDTSPLEVFREMFDFTQALPGFLLMTTASGRILYISENVMEFLGHSVVDVMTQSETIFDLIDSNDKHLFEKIFGSEDKYDENCAVPSEDCAITSLLDEKLITFSCRMGMLRHARRNPSFDRYKKMRICGRFVQIAGCDPCDRTFVALCSPRLNHVMASEPSSIFDTMVFQSVHRFDMKFVNIDHNGQFHLGYSEEEIGMMSWYSLIHPDDIVQATNKHTELIQATSPDVMCSLCVRMQTRYGNVIWVQMIMQKSSSPDMIGEPLITCVNNVVSEAEANIDDKEDEPITAPVNFNSNLGSTENKINALPTIVVDEVFVVEDKPDRAEVLRRLKRKMTKTDKTIKKSSRIDDSYNPGSSGSAEQSFREDLSPLQSSTNPSLSSSFSYSDNSTSFSENPSPYQTAASPYHTAPTPYQAAPSPFHSAQSPYQTAQSPFLSAPSPYHMPPAYYPSMVGSISELSPPLTNSSEEQIQDFGSPMHFGNGEDQQLLLHDVEDQLADAMYSGMLVSVKPEPIKNEEPISSKKNAADLPQLDDLDDFFNVLEVSSSSNLGINNEVKQDLESMIMTDSYNQSMVDIGNPLLQSWANFPVNDSKFHPYNAFSERQTIQSQTISAGGYNLTWSILA